MTFLLLPLLAVIAAASPTPAPTPQQLFRALPRPTPPADYQLHDTQIMQYDVTYGLIAPYCDPYGGILSTGALDLGAPWPLILQCSSAKIRVERPDAHGQAKVTKL
jgi:hypothetical protein